MDTQQLSSITVRGSKALVKWMRWEAENNLPSPTKEELLRIMADIIADHDDVDIKRRPGPGRPPKKKPDTDEEEPESAPPVVVRLALPLPLTVDAEVVAETCWPTAEAWGAAMIAAGASVEPIYGEADNSIIGFDWNLPHDIDPDLDHRLTSDADVWLDEAWASGCFDEERQREAI